MKKITKKMIADGISSQKITFSIEDGSLCATTRNGWFYVDASISEKALKDYSKKELISLTHKCVNGESFNGTPISDGTSSYNNLYSYLSKSTN